jgi:hypothetical protein
VSASTVFSSAAATRISAEAPRYRIVPYQGPIRNGVKLRRKRQQHGSVTNHRNGLGADDGHVVRPAVRTVMRTSAPDITRFHTESGDVSRRLDTQIRTLVDDLVRDAPRPAPPWYILRQPGSLRRLTRMSLGARQRFTGRPVSPRRPPWLAGALVD